MSEDEATAPLASPHEYLQGGPWFESRVKAFDLIPEFEALFDFAPEALCLCDSKANILLANRAARPFFAQLPDAITQNGALNFRLKFQKRSLSMAGAAALCLERASPAMFHIDQQSDVPLSVLLIPIYRTAAPQDGPDSRRILIAFMDRAPPSIETDLLKLMFGLTKAEARLVSSLVKDMTISEIAAQTGISKDTLRSQLKSTFAKLGVRRQTELVRLVLTLTRLATSRRT